MPLSSFVLFPVLLTVALFVFVVIECSLSVEIERLNFTNELRSIEAHVIRFRLELLELSTKFASST
jgi:hypothetical protein